VDFRILGPLEVIDDGRSLVLGGCRQRAVLAILLIHAGQVVSAESLIDQLWMETPPKSAVSTLRGYVSHLRRVLEPQREVGMPAQVLATAGPGYVVRIAADQLDATRFETLVAQARLAVDSGRLEEAIIGLNQALALWRGPALADFAFEAFAQAEIARLDELRLAALELRVDAALALGRHAEVVCDLEALVIAHPLRERLCGQLMVALYRSGRQVEALAAYQHTRRALDELGIEPSPALKRLEQTILCQPPELTWPPHDRCG
jgi:DNA-binding SARP family transcriptional activator